VTQPRTRSHSADALQAGGSVRVARRVRPGYSRGIGADPHFVPVLTTEFDGYIEEVRDDGVAVRRVDSGEIEWLPPLADGYERAAPGTYTPVCVV
jgi:hypothetical protein